MSHFALLVVTEHRPSDADLKKLLQPFHEYESDGVNDEYVENVNKTEEARESYEESTSRKLRDLLTNKLHDPYEPEFYRDPTEEESKKIGPVAGSGSAAGILFHSQDWKDGLGYRTKVQFIPEGYEEVRLNDTELMTFAEFAADYFGLEIVKEGDLVASDNEELERGWVKVDANGDVIEVIDRTNPNKKWDWWSVGGRWSGHLKPTQEADALPSNHPNVPEKGEAGLMGTQSDVAGVDIIRKGDVDFEYMRSRAVAKAETLYNKVRIIVGDSINDFKSWEEMEAAQGETKDWDALREAYHGQEAKKRMNEAAKLNRDLFWIDLEQFRGTEEEYVEAQRLAATVLFAFLRDGKWAERGEMGWWAAVSNEKTDWSKQFNDLLDNVPDDHWLTVVDCHI